MGSFVGSADNATGSGTSGTASLTLPTVSTGDVALVCIQSSTGSQSYSSWSLGTWNQIGSTEQNSTVLNSALFWAVLDASDSGQTLSVSLGSTGRWAMGVMVFSGIDTVSPIAASAATQRTATSATTTIDYPAATPTDNNQIVAAFGACRGRNASDTPTFTAGTNYTEAVDESSASSSNNMALHGIYRILSGQSGVSQDPSNSSSSADLQRCNMHTIVLALGGTTQSATATLAVAFSNSADGTVINEGAGTAGVTFANTATATAVREGSGSLAAALSNTATAAVERNASASLAVAFSNTATQSSILSASASLSVALSDSGSGIVIDEGGGALVVAFSNSATVMVVNDATGSLSVALSNTATADVNSGVIGSLAVAFSNTATAAPTRNATATSTVTFADTASAEAQRNGSGSLAVAFSNSATAVVGRNCAAALTVALANSATAAVVRNAVAALSVGFSNTATGDNPGSSVTFLFQEDYEGTPGGAMNFGNTEWNIFNGAGTRTFENFPTPIYGNTLGQYNGGQSLTKDDTALPGPTNGGTVRTDLAMRAYVSLDSVTSLTLTRLIVFEQSAANGGVDVCAVRMNANGTLRLIDGTSTVGSTSTHALGTSPTRLEYEFDQVANTQTLHMWWGSDLQSASQAATNYEAITGALTNNGDVEVFGIGFYATQTTNHSLFVEEFAVGYGGLLGPVQVVKEISGSLPITVNRSATAAATRAASASLAVALGNTATVGNPPVTGSAALSVALSNSATADTLWEELFEGSDGTNVTTSNTTLSGVGLGGSLQFESDFFVPQGNTKMRLSTTAQSRILNRTVSRVDGDISVARFYYNPATTPLVGNDIFRFHDSVGAAPRVRIEKDATGAIILRDGNTNRYTFSHVLGADEWVRIEVMVDEAANQINARMWWGTSLHSTLTSGSYETSGVRTWTQGDFDQIRFGHISTITATSEYDAIAWKKVPNNSTWIGPPINANTPPGPIEIDGSLPIAVNRTASAQRSANATATPGVVMANTASAVVVRSAQATLGVALSNSVSTGRVVDAQASLALALSNSAASTRIALAQAALDIQVDMAAAMVAAGYAQTVGQLWPRGGG